MQDFFIFNHSQISTETITTFTVVFFPDQTIAVDVLKKTLKEYFQDNTPPDNLILIGGSYIQKDLINIFVDNFESIFDVIPGFLRKYYHKFSSIYCFGEEGKLEYVEGKKIAHPTLDQIIRSGMVQIFINRGGEITSPDTHHYVFPSGKHCNKFLRPGNVLLYSSEIYFIGFNLLRKYIDSDINCIYCDTSSINSLAFALIELKKRFRAISTPQIRSFGSYEKFETEKFEKAGSAIVLISSSTSGGIIERFKDDRQVPLERMALIYYLGPRGKYSSVVICDLNIDKEKGIIGLDSFKSTSSEIGCKYCESGSVPVKVTGDVFLLERPQIKRVMVGTSHAPPKLSKMMKEFKAEGRNKINLWKCQYSEVDSNFDIFFDFETLIKESEKFPDYWKKCMHLLKQYLPSQLDCLIYLDDQASFSLAKMIVERFGILYVAKPKMFRYDEFVAQNPNKDKSGACMVICSCLVTGKNLLYVSKILRDYENLSITYFVGLARTMSKSYLEDIKKNLRPGTLLGATTNIFSVVETVYIPARYKDTAWDVELKFLKDIIAFCRKKPTLFGKAKVFFEKRERVLANCGSTKGLANELFLNSIKEGPLFINKNFAFFDFTGFNEDVSQADIYVTMASVLNNLRNPEKDYKECLIQTEYARNIISPSNFYRFNDGIIQASILRASNFKELSYHYEEEDSIVMANVLKNVIDHYQEPHGEALLEFLYALAIVKLQIKDHHLKEIVHLLNKVKNPIAKCFVEWIKDRVLHGKTDTFKKYNNYH